MQSKKFGTYLNPYVAFTPIDEQISIWLENNPNVKVNSIKLNQKDALVTYENQMEAGTKPTSEMKKPVKFYSL